MPERRVGRTPKHTRLTAAVTDGVAAFCVGERGLLAERVGPGDWWARSLNGPTGDRRDLLDAALTARNERLWFCGREGTLGSYDRVTGAVRAYPLPEHAEQFSHVVVRGRRGTESVLVADGRGRVLRLSATAEGVSVDGATVLGDGTALTALITTPEWLVAADLAGRLYWSDDGRRVRGRRLATVAVAGLAHADSTGVVAVDEAGRLYRHALPTDENRLEVTELGVDSPSAVAAAGERIVVAGGRPYCGPENSGDGRLLVVDGSRGVRAPEQDEPFYGAAMLADGTVLAVGCTGLVAERTAE